MDAVLGKIGFDWQLALFNFVNIFLIFLILKKWAFGPISQIIEKRKIAIEEGIASAKQAQNALDAAKETKEVILAQAREEARAIIQGAEKEAKGLVETSRATALKEHGEIVHKAQLDIEVNQKEASEKLRKEAGSLIARSVRKILGEEVDEKMNERIIQKVK